MKPKLRDYLTIIFALLIIFVCGCGVGFLIGEKEGRQETETANAIGSEHDSGHWEKQTMESLGSRLDLSDDQREKILGEIEATSLEIANNQETAIEDTTVPFWRFTTVSSPIWIPISRKKSRKIETSYNGQLIFVSSNEPGLFREILDVLQSSPSSNLVEKKGINHFPQDLYFLIYGVSIFGLLNHNVEKSSFL